MSQAEQRGGAYPDPAMNEAVDLDASQKREILDMERTMQYRSHFEVLGLALGASPDAVKRAFHDASRRFHPDRYFGKHLGSFKGRLERIFQRLSEASAVLSDPSRREAYLKEHPELEPAPTPPNPIDDARAAERRARMARHPYLAQSRKLTELVTDGKAALEKGDFTRAYTQLTAASKMEPKNREISMLLGDVRRKQELAHVQQELEEAKRAELEGNHAKAVHLYRSVSSAEPQNAVPAAKVAALMMRLGEDARQAKIFAQKAVDLDPENVGYRVLLGKILVAAGAGKLAKREFEKALERDPNHAEAKELMRKLRWTF